MITLPAFWTGNAIAEDSLIHLVRSRHFVSQLVAGELYPRWLAGVNDGLGSPIMFFYGPVPYYITAMFRPLASGDLEGWHQLGLAASLAVIASGYAAYVWLRKLGSGSAALIGALLYMGEPYHLAVDLYQRFAFAELWGFVWVPLVLWNVHRVVEGYKTAILGLSASYALLIMTHLPTTLLFSLVPPLYALSLASSGGKVRAGSKAVGAMLLGVGLSAVYLVPAVLLQSSVQTSAMSSGKFYFANNFLFHFPDFISSFGESQNYLNMVMGRVIIVIAGAYVLGRRLLCIPEVRLARFWMSVGAAAFFMLLPLSRPVWELLPVLQKIQFPCRFGCVLALSMAALLTLWLGVAGRLLSRANIALLAIISLIGVSEAVPVFKQYLNYPIWSRQPSLDWLRIQMARNGESTVVEAAQLASCTDFLPLSSPLDLFGAQFGVVSSLVLLRSLAAVPDVVVAPATQQPSQLSLRQISPRHLVLTVQSRIPLLLRIRQFYFPGWEATVRGQSKGLKIQPSRPFGMIELESPAGNHSIDLVLQAEPAEYAGRLVSLFSFIIFFACWARLRYLARRGRSLFAIRPELEEHGN